MTAPKKVPKEANLKPPWKEGESGNPKGRQKGQRNYATIYREAMKKIAEKQNITPEELEEILVQSGLAKALKGDFSFYRDTMDRLHGKPLQSLGITTGKDGAAALAAAMMGVNADDSDTTEGAEEGVIGEDT